MDDFIDQSEIKVETYVDLLTRVAGVPSFLLIIYQYLLQHFESFYSDYKMYQSFKEKKKSTDSDKKKPMDPGEEMSLFSQLCVFLMYENPLVKLIKGITSKLKICSRKTRLKEKIKSIKHVSNVLKDRLDLKKILIQLHNFDLNL